jgi:5'-deoxynucleotidase YfbR-like HD superfamily hydrolase
MTELKSSYEIALARMKGMGIEESRSLTEEQRQRIAEIKREHEAKAAEKKILLNGAEELAEELRRLEMRRDEKIQAIYQEAHDLKT